MVILSVFGYVGQWTKINIQGPSTENPVYPEVHSGLHHAYKMDQLANIVGGWKSLVTFFKNASSHVFAGPWMRLHLPNFDISEKWMMITSKGLSTESTMCSQARDLYKDFF